MPNSAHAAKQRLERALKPGRCQDCRLHRAAPGRALCARCDERQQRLFNS